MKTGLLAAAMALAIGSVCWAQTDVSEIPAAPGEGARAAVPAEEHIPPYPHATLPAGEMLWPGPMIIVVAGMFLAAAFIGALHHSELPPEESTAAPAVAHGHDDAHGHH